jgi:ketosteroid isomerase-like protein
MTDGSRTLDVVRRFQAAWDAHDLEATLALVTDDCAFESARTGERAGRIEGREALRAAWAPGFAAAGGTFEVEELFAADDRAVQRWRYVDGTTEVRGVDVFRVRDGRIAEKLGYVKVS